MVSILVSTLTLFALCLAASGLPSSNPEGLSPKPARSSFNLGKCPEPEKPSQKFDLDNYLGLWFEIQRSRVVFELGLTCVTAEYSLNKDGSITVDNAGTTFLGFDVTVSGIATQTNQSNILGVKFFPAAPAAPYWVVETDYKTYSLVVSCNEVLDLVPITNAWILSRNKTLDAAVQKKLLQKLETLGISRSMLSPTEQNNCGY